MPNREFLETYALYRKFNCKVQDSADKLPKPSIKMWCEVCHSDQTFNMVNDYWDGYAYTNVSTAGSEYWLRYKCMWCNNYKRNFFIKIGDKLDFITKIGQYPAWNISGNKDIEALLGDHKEYFRRGQICESQGYGIAAFAYYRRIVEEVIDQLLNEIVVLMAESEKVAYEAALEKTKQTRVATEKIDLVKDLLPPILRPSNMNPLSVLHGKLSEGLHAESDEECLDSAASVREILVFLTAQVTSASKAARSFTEGMKMLLDKKGKK